MLEDLVKKTDYNAKISEKESKICSISGLATADVSNLVWIWCSIIRH